MMAGILVWCLMAGMEAAAVGLQAKLLFTNLGYFGVCAVSPLFVWFSLVYSGKGGILTPPRAALLWAIPAATLLLAFTNSWHHILWTGFTVAPSGNMLLYAHGPWFWVWVFYAAAATCAGTGAPDAVRAGLRAVFPPAGLHLPDGSGHAVDRGGNLSFSP